MLYVTIFYGVGKKHKREVENSCEWCIKYSKSNRMCLRSIRWGVVHMSSSGWGMSWGGGMHGFGYMSNTKLRTKTTFVLDWNNVMGD